jgi:hypothetical protein
MYLALKKHLPRCVILIIKDYYGPRKPLWIQVPLIVPRRNLRSRLVLKDKVMYKWVKI